jgi:hypothetical protein
LSAFTNVSFPDFLYAVRIISTSTISQGSSSSQNITSVVGITAMATSKSSSSSSSVSTDVAYYVRTGYSGPVPSTRHVFFLDKDNADNQSILNAINSISPQYDPLVKNWPKVFPEPVVIVTFGSSSSRSQSTSGVYRSSPQRVLPTGESNNTSSGSSASQTVIPPTLHRAMSPKKGNTGQVIINAPSTAPELEDNKEILDAPNISVDEIIEPTLTESIPATSPEKFPAGNFLINIETEAYRYGLVRVSCTVAHVDEDYVAVPPTQ